MVVKSEADETPSLVLIDAHALLHRSFHAIPMLTHRGQAVNAVYGFASTILHVIEELKPTYLAVAFDEPGPTFRHEDFAAYKAHRPETPESLQSQFPLARQLTRNFGIPYFGIPGYEADDIIGTLTKQAEGKDVDVIIVTGDHDAYQLINESVKVYNVSRGTKAAEFIDADAVRRRYGFGPESMLDYKALRGDVSDGIPGVPGVGEKTAAKLIAQFGTVEQLYEALEYAKDKKLEGVSDKLRALLTEHAETAFLSKKLATIRADVPIALDLKACTVKH
ncbi:DNA polymerase I, partial [Candidatus Berkelbacteria bacterium]|nr:DNA polymerase I [Candidatus Berkelbacteria bacterium]